MESLNSLIAYYQNTGLGLSEILERLSLRIYNYPVGKFRASEDDCGEFYLFFYPRLLRSLSRFRDRGKPFEWYFNSVLRWHYKMYCARKRREQARWTAARSALLWELPDPVSGPLVPNPASGECRKIIPIDRLGGSREATSRRRILFLALKNAQHLDDSALPWISGLTGVKEDHLAGMIEQLRAKLYKRELRLHKLYLRQNRVFSRIFLLQQDLISEADPGARSALVLSLAVLREKLRSLQRNIRRIRLHPSNREIAELLRIPKGTVDTSLYCLRRQLLERKAEPDPEKLPRQQPPLSA
jgi:hypothetical protein